MKIFFLKKDEILPHVEIENSKFKSEKRSVEHQLGRFLVKFAAKNLYKVEDTEIVVKNHKPEFENSQLYFSISHSKNVVAVAFDDYDIGLDVEFMKERNFEKICKYLKAENIKNLQEFYEYWTRFEAEYKSKKQNLKSFVFENYMISVSFSEKSDNFLTLYQLKFLDNKFSFEEVEY